MYIRENGKVLKYTTAYSIMWDQVCAEVKLNLLIYFLLPIIWLSSIFIFGMKEVLILLLLY